MTCEVTAQTGRILPTAIASSTVHATETESQLGCFRDLEPASCGWQTKPLPHPTIAFSTEGHHGTLVCTKSDVLEARGSGL